MQLNAMFPTRDIGNDPAKIRDWAQAAEDLGFATIEVADHVLGAAARDGWVPTYSEKDAFHETFVTLGFLAAVTKRIRLSSGVLIAPQRQTALIAKQAAEVDLLSGGRLRLGIGVGWNHVEYEALGMDWSTRGARQAEQIEVMRRLWTEELVTFDGRFHSMRSVNIVPPPVQRPIPIWLGGASEAAIKRAARLGDGWMPIMAPGAEAEARMKLFERELAANGRDRARVGVEVWMRLKDPSPASWIATTRAWQQLGVDMVMFYPMFRLERFDDQIDVLRRYKEAMAV